MDRALADIIEAIDTALEGRGPRTSPAPWFAWLTVALLRQRARQAWHRYIVDTHLRGQEQDEESGDVPGLPGWTYNFHGSGCCLIGPDGEAIDVDRHDSEARVIDPYFFARRIRTVRSIALPEIRLWRWMPTDAMIVAALAELRAMGALVYPRGDHLFLLAEPLEARVQAMTKCRFDDDLTREIWLAAFHDRDADDHALAHRAWVRSRAMDTTHAYNVLDAARDILVPNELTEVCLHHIAGPAGPAMGKALAVLRETIASEGVAAVSSLVDRLSPTGDPPYPAHEAFAYLLERGAANAHVVDRFGTFAAVEKARGFRGNPFLGRYAILALRFLPSRAMILVRRALRCNTPICVTEVAALLAAIDRPWCVRELTSALADVPGASAIAEALRRCTGDLAKRHAAKLYAPPTHDPSRLGFTYEEVADANARNWFEEPLRDAKRIAQELLTRYPATWDGGEVEPESSTEPRSSRH
ncbi:DUF6896 domain-containing protein [Pendulispora albinea]|uniref:DUF6896 domain-containing protein n=1 Tax=Pendulispora albinea TaxID=2741071 RepID=A0ABZ2LQC6_9BACT